MNENPDAFQHLPVPLAKVVKFGKRLARLKRRLIRALSGEPEPAAPALDHAYWSSILTGKMQQKCPARDFLRVSIKLRKSGNLQQSERICALAVARYPSELSLAIEHAEIAKASKDLQAGITRWQKVVDLGGDQARASAFRNLADCQRALGNFDKAETILRRGLEIHPGEFLLMERLAGICCASGNAAEALGALRTLIDAHPDNDHAPSYFRMSLALREEGLLDRADDALREGLEKYPDDSKLRNSLAELSFLREKPSMPLKVCEPVSAFTAHLFQDRCAPFGQGVLGFSIGTSVFSQHVPAMLDFAETVSPLEEPARISSVDVFAIWGAPSDENAPIREFAESLGKPLLCLDSGFLSSLGIESREAPALSVIVNPDAVYYDATRPSELIHLLNSDAFTLTDGQRARAETCIASIVANRLSKFNHAPRIDLRPRFPADGTRRILLIDQRKGGASIHRSLGGHATFERMWETALAMPDCQILVKIHPEAIASSSRSQLAALLPSPLPGNVVVIDFDVNPHDLLEVVDDVFVATSQMGFEAVLAGKEVHCFAAPYYAGWGFTRDRAVVPRRKKRRTPAEVFHLYHIARSRYFVPERGVAEIEDLITYLTTVRDRPLPSAPVRESASGPLKILIILPSGRDGATGRYIRHLSAALTDLGCGMMVLAEGNCPRLDSGVRWLKMEFKGSRLASSLRREIVGFAPDFVYVNGYRSRSQRAALEAVVLTGARLAMQSEDDDIQVHRHRRSEEEADLLGTLDRPRLTTAEIAGFLKNHDWNHSLHALLDPRFDHGVEPLFRILCHRMACLHTAIWHPFAERLAREYAVPTLVVPPVASAADFERIPMTPQERTATLQRYGIDPATTVIFIGGALYSYSDEFAVFLTALDLAAREPAANFSLVVTSNRSSLPLARMAADRLDSSVSFTDIDVAADSVYLEMLKACDIVCSPGLPDDFNRYRLPSRLVKAMAMAKPILTCRCGFGESLEHGHNAFLMDGEDPAAWAASIALTRDAAIRTRVGIHGQEFAKEHFASTRVALELKSLFEKSLTSPPQRLSGTIAISPDEQGPKAGFRRRDLVVSSMNFAFQKLGRLTHRIDTVVHLGAGSCEEFDAYCRLGARQILLVESSARLAAGLRTLAGTNPAILVSEARVGADVALGELCADLDLSGSHNLLVLEIDDRDFPSRWLASSTLQRFQWIATDMKNIAEETIHGILTSGFEARTLQIDHSTSRQPALFENVRRDRDSGTGDSPR